MKIRRLLIALAAAAGVAGCDITKSSDPRQTLPEILPTTFISMVGTLRHTVVVQHPVAAQDEPRILSVSGWVTNTGALSHRVIVRVCTPLPEDLAAEGGGIQFIGLDPACETNEDTLDLAGGQSTPQMMGRFRLEGGPGLYTIRVRQLLSPSSVTNITTRIK